MIEFNWSGCRVHYPDGYGGYVERVIGEVTRKQAEHAALQLEAMATEPRNSPDDPYRVLTYYIHQREAENNCLVRELKRLEKAGIIS